MRIKNQRTYKTTTTYTYSASKGEMEKHIDRQIIPAVGECNHCSRDVYLHGFTNTCECGIDYNMSGQELAHRSHWGEETGESLADILSIVNEQ